MRRSVTNLSFAVLILFSAGSLRSEPIAVKGWQATDSATARPFFEIRGTGDRQNPVRRSISKPFSGDELFVSFRLRYDGKSIDAPPNGDGEFFVFWLDELEGGNESSHSGNVPNIGIHVDGEGKNRFMVRYHSQGEVFGPEIQGDRDTVVVARIAKSSSGAEMPYDELSLWVDPKGGDLKTPLAVAKNAKALSEVRWIGFSTARKTELEDRILVGDVRLGSKWEDLFGDAAAAELTEIPAPPKYTPPAPPKKLAEVDPQPDSIETDHWSFQPRKRPPVPAGSFPDWVRNPIDAFVAKQHEELGLTPAQPADERTLTRRISLVLTGLPPERVVKTGGMESYVDELLDSTAYGERWGRHWLDVARWAESNGHQHNRNRAHAWRYRDWVVQSFVENKPYDQFLREQIAGDEIETFDERNIVATGFLAAARYSGNELDKKIQRNDILVDITNTTAKAFLGLTMECAQCHDHFFDPVSQWDYYNLMAFFAKGQPGDVILDAEDSEVAELVSNHHGIFESVRSRIVERKREAGTPEPVLVIPKSVPGSMTAAEKRTFSKITEQLNEKNKAWAFYSPVTSPHELEFSPLAVRWPLPFQKESLETVSVRFLDRGNVTSPGPVAEPAWPLVFGDSDIPSDRPRLALADWLTSPEHPLTARVWVNRIWQWHFGTGLVSTSGDFGVAGSKPTHPELLDWLASELIDSDWDTKHIHRLILESNTFRQGSQFAQANADRDPDNVHLWRWMPRRLEAEAIRDSVLAVSGALNSKVGGPSVALAETDDSQRRSLYLQQRRDNLPHQQMLFDAANAVTSCAKRRVSTVGLQPLWMLNSKFIQSRAEEIAKRIQVRASPEDAVGSNARRLVEDILLREASPEEMLELTHFIEDAGLDQAAALLLNTNEFIYIP